MPIQLFLLYYGSKPVELMMMKVRGSHMWHLVMLAWRRNLHRGNATNPHLRSRRKHVHDQKFYLWVPTRKRIHWSYLSTVRSCLRAGVNGNITAVSKYSISRIGLAIQRKPKWLDDSNTWWLSYQQRGLQLRMDPLLGRLKAEARSSSACDHSTIVTILLEGSSWSDE